MFLKLTLPLAISLSLFTNAFADTNFGVPLDPNGNTIPAPVGNIPFFKMPNALASGKGEFTWDYAGTLSNNQQKFSLESSIFQVIGDNKFGAGMHLFDFGFKQGNHYFFSDSTYGGEDNKNQAILQSVDLTNSAVSFKNLTINATSVINPANQWHVTSIDCKPQGPIYEGWVGQPGHEYQLTGSGKTFLWQYDQYTKSHIIAPYTYQFTVKMIDERGATMEGIASGYIGPNIGESTSVNHQYNIESEIAQPELKVKDWSVKLTAVNPDTPNFDNTYDFNGNSGMLWDDFGPLVVHGATNQARSTIIDAIKNNASQAAADKLKLTDQSSIQSDNHGLYDGNWLPIQFTSGKYKGVSLVFTTFWNDNPNNTPPKTTDDYHWSTYGWVNYYSGIIPGNIDSANALTETLYPQNPDIPTAGEAAGEKTPYTVTIDRTINPAFTPAHPWASSITFTIKPNTPLRYAMASYANQLAHNQVVDDPNTPIVIHLNTISPVAENTLFSKNISQYYEAAAVPTINGQVVGTGWIENMY